MATTSAPTNRRSATTPRTRITTRGAATTPTPPIKDTRQDDTAETPIPSLKINRNNSTGGTISTLTSNTANTTNTTNTTNTNNNTNNTNNTTTTNNTTNNTNTNTNNTNALTNKLTYGRVHCSFQSTGSGNIRSVNSLNSNHQQFSSHKKVGRRGKEKHLVHIGSKLRKYYQSAVSHGEALAIFYSLRNPWTISVQEEAYRTCITVTPKKLYPADELLCENAQMSKHQRSRADRRRGYSYTTSHGLVLTYHSRGTVFESKGVDMLCLRSIKTHLQITSPLSTSSDK
eukprot:jgi/Psemu1/2980/gm1.2980_g